MKTIAWVMGGFCLLLAGNTAAWGQAIVDQEPGHALDANNRVGGGGYNSQETIPPIATGNDVVNGDVTNGAAFRGVDSHGVNLGPGYTSPTAFRGLLPGMEVDQFIANSAGTPSMSNPTASTMTISGGTQPFFGTSNTVQPPPGFVAQPFSLGYVPAQAAAPNAADWREGEGEQAYNFVALPRPGDAILPGQVDLTSNAAPIGSAAANGATAGNNKGAGFFMASPLFGVSQWATQSVAAAPPRLPAGANMNINSASAQQPLNNQNPNQPGNGTTSTGTLLPNLAMTMVQPMTVSQQLPPLMAGNSQVSAQEYTPVVGDSGTGQTNREYLPPTPLTGTNAPSAKIEEMRRRMRDYENAKGLTDEEAHREFLQLLRARRALMLGSEGSGAAAPGGAAGNPGGEVAPQVNPSPATPPPQPVQLASLADGVKSKELADGLQDDEKLVEDGKYDQAMQAYTELAQTETDNAPLITLGRSVAELGGAYFQQAATDLHTAFKADDAMMVSQYDLLAHLGAKRVQALNDDLKKIADQDPSDTTAPFLLAYIAYNTHHPDEASQWLSQCDQRSNGTDEIVTVLQKYWK